jgi:hypothetical protein
VFPPSKPSRVVDRFRLPGGAEETAGAGGAGFSYAKRLRRSARRPAELWGPVHTRAPDAPPFLPLRRRHAVTTGAPEAGFRRRRPCRGRCRQGGRPPLPRKEKRPDTARHPPEQSR